MRTTRALICSCAIVVAYIALLRARTTAETTPPGCGRNEFPCLEDGVPKICIPMSWVCDGANDCNDGSDEKNCTKRACDDNNQFTCNSGECIPKHWRCDGDKECSDGSDEEGCSRNEKCDPKTQFQCESDAMCISRTWVCDGDYDCRDRSDESACHARIEGASSCSHNEFRCHSSHECISSLFKCDGEKDCRDGSDELHCANCEQIGICSQKCLNTDSGYECQCYPGYVHSDEPSETEIVNGNRVGVCRATGNSPRLIVSTKNTIWQFGFLEHEAKRLVTGFKAGVAVDFFHKNSVLIWSDVILEKIFICYTGEEPPFPDIQECRENNFENLTLTSEKIVTPDGLAVDWVHQLLYWTDTGLNQISVMDLQTRRRRVLFKQDMDEPRGIAVDPFHGLVFWSDWGKEARIERAGMDGSHRTVVVFGDAVVWPNGLALDLLDKRVYWIDAKVKAIMSCDYAGGNSRSLLVSRNLLQHPFSVAVFEDKVYWTDWALRSVMSANKFFGTDVKTVMDGIAGIMSVRVYHKLAQPEYPSKCSNHTCDHLCLPRPDPNVLREESLSAELPYKCACADGYVVRVGSPNFCIPEGKPIAEESRAEQFECPEYGARPKRSIPLSWKCDGQYDCADGADEKDCNQKFPKCAVDELQCRNGACVFKNWKCDGRDDCGDGTDEQGCLSICDLQKNFQCKNHNICISRIWICDGKDNCPDGSDEFNCAGADRGNLASVVECRKDEFRCRSKTRCINSRYRCDGEMDCGDGSDEDDCDYGSGERKIDPVNF